MRTDSFVGIRILLILGIVGGHCGNWFMGGPEICTFFFMISGFFYNWHPVLGGDMLTNSILREYYKRKLIKVYPIYWLCFLIGAFISGWSLNLYEFPYLLLLQSWIPSTSHAYYNYLGVSWFLSSLFFCYIVSPFVYRIFYQKSKTMLVVMLVTLLAIMQVYILRFSHTKYDEWPVYIFPLYCLAEYTCGMIFGKLIKDIPESQTPWTMLISWIYLIAWLACMNLRLFDRSCWYMHLALIWCLYVYNTKSIRVILGNKICKWFGLFIMQIYLIHQVIIIKIQDFVGNDFVTGIIAVTCGLVLGIIWTHRKNLILNWT